ncbi:MAG: ATPase [Sphingomonadaceae bacterium]
MTKRSHIRAIGQHEQPDAALTQEDTAPQTETEEVFEPEEEWLEEPVTPERGGRVLASLALAIALGWTAFFVWANLTASQVQPSPQQWTQLVATWAVPVLLIGVIWLLAMRNSAREAARFGAVAHSLSTQSAQLEHRLSSVNRELSLAREFLSTQTRELEFLGRSAVERISGPAEQLRDLVSENGERIDSIARVSVTALDNMKSLREDLPVVTNAARDASNQIGGAGRTAKSQLAELVSGFERLNDFGQASERQVTTLRNQIGESLESFDTRLAEIERTANARFEAMRQDSDALHGELDNRQAEAIAALREQMEAMRQEISASGSAFIGQQEAALAAMRERISSLEAEAGHVAESLRSGERSAIEAWQGQIANLKDRLTRAIEEIAQLDAKAIENANGKLKALTSEAERVDEKLIERNRLFEQQVGERERSFEAAQAQALERFYDRLTALDKELAERRDAQDAQLEAIAQHHERLREGVAQIDMQIAALAERGEQTEAGLVRSSNRLAETVEETNGSLEETEQALAKLTDASVRVLELIQASAKHSKTELPAALGVFEARLAEARSTAGAAVGLLEQGTAASNDLMAAIERLREEGEGATSNIDGLRERLSNTVESQTTELGVLREQILSVDSETSALAQRISTTLRDSLGQFEDAGREVLETLENQQKDHIQALVGRIGDESAQAIEQAFTDLSKDTIEQLNVATAKASETSRDLIGQLRDQLARVNELTGNLETRIAGAREQAEEQVDNDFSRRVALITESLNSNAIDIAKVLSTEVTDTAWASYLRGDRSVFTRRAVRLIDNSQSREIANLYDADTEFRGHVSRYIHDFEAMLRTMLSTRDGNALGVTLLSSDMGKLYVVLAQAIERLRE